MPETFMGVDVGLRLHVVIRLAAENNRAVFIGEVGSFGEAEVLLNQFNVRRCVIDAAPERQGAIEFAAKFSPRVWLCLYDRPREITCGPRASVLNLRRFTPYAF